MCCGISTKEIHHFFSFFKTAAVKLKFDWFKEELINRRLQSLLLLLLLLLKRTIKVSKKNHTRQRRNQQRERKGWLTGNNEGFLEGSSGLLVVLPNCQPTNFSRRGCGGVRAKRAGVGESPITSTAL